MRERSGDTEYVSAFNWRWKKVGRKEQKKKMNVDFSQNTLIPTHKSSVGSDDFFLIGIKVVDHKLSVGILEQEARSCKEMGGQKQ